MKFFVRTAYGVTDMAYSNLTKMLLGVMQGAGHSGALWALISSGLLDIMDKMTGATFHPPFPSKDSCQRPGEAFVDDTALWVLRLGLMFAMITAIMQQSAQKWAGLIFATGGALNLLKCFWYGVNWYFTDAGEPKMRKIQDDDQDITISPSDDPMKTQTVTRVEVTKGMRTLGV